MRTQGWVGPLIGLIVCLILLWILVPATSGILHTLLFVILLIGAVVSAVYLVLSLVRRGV
jgi:hypothetical protein